jgi:hypothetical protein
VTIQSRDTILVSEMNAEEILICLQAIINGHGLLKNAPDCWPHIALALESIYESIAEYVDQEQPKIITYLRGHARSRSFDYFSQANQLKSFMDIALSNLCQNISIDVNARLRRTRSLLDVVFSEQKLGIGPCCFYFNCNSKTVFIIQTEDPITFYRIDLTDRRGQFYTFSRHNKRFLNLGSKAKWI